MNERNYEGLTTAQILKYFFIDIKAWVEDITVNEDTHPYFNICIGLCSNLDNWIDQEDLWSQIGEIKDEFYNSLEGYKCMTFPFNGGENIDYDSERNKYTNPERLKFINRMAEEL